MGFKSISSKERHSASHRLDENLAQYGDAFATVGKVTIYSVGMKLAPGLTHHYLLIEVLEIENVKTEEGDLLTLENCCILAERTKVENKFEVVVREIITRKEEAEKRQKGTVKHAVDLTGNHEPIKIKVNELVDTLKQVVPKHYTVTKHNCWKFAHDGFSALIQKIIEISDDISRELKDKLDKALTEMPGLCLPNDAAPFFKGALFFFGVVGGCLLICGLGAITTLAAVVISWGGIPLSAGVGVCLVAVGAYYLFRAIQYGWDKKGNSGKKKIRNFGKNIAGLGQGTKSIFDTLGQKWKRGNRSSGFLGRISADGVWGFIHVWPPRRNQGYASRSRRPRRCSSRLPPPHRPRHRRSRLPAPNFLAATGGPAQWSCRPAPFVSPPDGGAYSRRGFFHLALPRVGAVIHRRCFSKDSRVIFCDDRIEMMLRKRCSRMECC